MKKNKLPDSFRAYFWDCDFDKLSWSKYSSFIIARIVSFGNVAAISWLMKMTNLATVRKVVSSSREIDPKTKNFWLIYGN